jgi:hypothetical protein
VISSIAHLLQLMSQYRQAGILRVTSHARLPPCRAGKCATEQLQRRVEAIAAFRADRPGDHNNAMQR